MDPRKLLYLASIVEQGSLKKAAKHLQLSQPALSTSMDRLEREMGAKLLKRSPMGVSPTPLGELLYAHAWLIRDELDFATQRVNNRGAGNEQAVTFGTLPSLANSIVPAAVCAWQKSGDTPPLRIAEKVQLDLLLSLIRGELDFIIGQTECYGFLEGLKQRVLFRDRLYVIGQPQHPAADIKDLSWSDLVGYPWIIQKLGKQRTLMERLLHRLPEQLTECGTVNCIKAIIAGSDSLALLPASAISADVRDGKIRPLNIVDPLLNRDIAVMFRERAPLTDAARDLVARVEAVGLALSRESLDLEAHTDRKQDSMLQRVLSQAAEDLVSLN